MLKQNSIIFYYLLGFLFFLFLFDFSFCEEVIKNIPKEVNVVSGCENLPMEDRPPFDEVPWTKKRDYYCDFHIPCGPDCPCGRMRTWLDRKAHAILFVLWSYTIYDYICLFRGWGK